MGKVKDLTGQVYGRLTVTEFAGIKNRKAQWLCECECGKKVVVCSVDLRSGNTKSCGCLRKENFNNRTHGLSDEPIYNIWRNIKARCFNPSCNAYKHYGGRGITMFPAWIHDFKAFYDYVSKLEHFGEEGYTLDREDNDGNYEPGNVRWATEDEQHRNQRSNIWIDYDGERIILKDAARAKGIDYHTLYMRYRAGDRGERLFRPVRK